MAVKAHQSAVASISRSVNCCCPISFTASSPGQSTVQSPAQTHSPTARPKATLVHVGNSIRPGKCNLIIAVCQRDYYAAQHLCQLISMCGFAIYEQQQHSLHCAHRIWLVLATGCGGHARWQLQTRCGCCCNWILNCRHTQSDGLLD